MTREQRDALRRAMEHGCGDNSCMWVRPKEALAECMDDLMRWAGLSKR